MLAPQNPETASRADVVLVPGVVLGLVGVVVVVVVVLIGWSTVRACDASRNRADRRVLVRQRRAEGRALTCQRLVIRSSLDPATLQAAIVRGLGLPYDTTIAVQAELFQGPVTPGHVQFCSATRVMTSFITGIRLEPTHGGGSTLTYEVERWTSADGIVVGIPQLKFLRRRVEEEARTADADVVVAVETAPERARR